jgi:hypothetical protein
MSLELGRILWTNDPSDGIRARDLGLGMLEVLRWDGVVWIGLALDRDKWRALVNSVMNIRVP